MQPVIAALIEVALWMAIFHASGSETFGGFTREYYLSYALWAAFFARISATWMYEFRMIDEIDTGSVNSILARPISFYEYYLAQFMGYKFITAGFSLLIPVVASLFFHGTTDLTRLPLALALSIYYLFLVHTISFTIASCGFFFNRVHSFTVAKNISLWMLSGELFPLDLVPQPVRGVILNLPFSNGAFVPVGYLTGRIDVAQVMHGFLTTTVGLLVMSVVANRVWRAGRLRYSGTGA